MHQYYVSTLEKIWQKAERQTPSVEEVFEQQRGSVCVRPLFALMQFSQRVNLSDEVLQSRRMLQEAALDMVILHNDLLSYPKEQSEGVPHNLIAAWRAGGGTAQAAVDFIAKELQLRHSMLQDAAKDLNSLFSGDEVRNHVEEVRNIISANLYRSFRSRRFFIDDFGLRIRTEGRIAFADCH